MLAMDDKHMIPLGYMLKHVASPAPEWTAAPAVRAIHSLSNCVSSDFADYIPLWKHNGWWLFDTSESVKDAAASQGIASDELSLFYYEAFDEQYNDKAGCWQPFAPEPSVTTEVVPPTAATLSGFDVVSFYVGTSPECSPLSCNGLAADLPVNERCLFDTFLDAYAAIERGEFKDCEPGPYRIVAVYAVDAANP
jgi:hypothetical protein